MASSVTSVITIESGIVTQPSLPEPPKIASTPYRRTGTSDVDIELNHRPSNGGTLPAPAEETISAEQIQTIWNPHKNRFRVLAACLTGFGNGMNDSAPGALIESIERLATNAPLSLMKY